MNAAEIGNRFGRLLVTDIVFDNQTGKLICICQCDCGKIHRTAHANLRGDRTLSCGCLRNDNRNKIKQTHNASKTPTYRAWISMKVRCEYPKSINYSRYGGRGIKVCERWQSFENFIIDMGEKPTGMSIDRIDNDGNYEPSNCRWATREEQDNNTSRSLFLEFNGMKMTVKQWSRFIGISYGTLRKRLSLGWSIEEALTRPVGG